MDDRFAICNMAIEAGAKNGIFSADEKTQAYLAGRMSRESVNVLCAGSGCGIYPHRASSILDKLDLTVAFPHLPGNARCGAGDFRKDCHSSRCVIGSCTNGRLEDMRSGGGDPPRAEGGEQACAAIVIPATQRIYLEAH